MSIAKFFNQAISTSSKKSENYFLNTDITLFGIHYTSLYKHVIIKILSEE